jgi:hypothetical protein
LFRAALKLRLIENGSAVRIFDIFPGSLTIAAAEFNQRIPGINFTIFRQPDWLRMD